jgi:hypothetical protein
LALEAGLESMVCAVAERAAEQAVASWLGHPTGAEVLARLGGSPSNRDNRAPDRADPDYLASALAVLGLAGRAESAGEDTSAEALGRASSGLAAVASQAVSGWQEQVLHVVRAENVTKRSIARVVSFDDESLALVLSIGVLGYADPDASSGEAAGDVPLEMLTSLFGAGLLRELGTRIRRDLHDRVVLLLREEAGRFGAVLASYEAPADTASTELLQAGYTLEGAR